MKDELIWMPHPGHLIISNDCRFHLNTYVNGYIVSTVGEWWPDRVVREIHAEVRELKWLEDNKHLKGDDFDYAYNEKFGFMEIGMGRKYETMVFKAKKETSKQAMCCPYTQTGSDLDMDGYNDAVSAFKGHNKMVKKWSALSFIETNFGKT